MSTLVLSHNHPLLLSLLHVFPQGVLAFLESTEFQSLPDQANQLHWDPKCKYDLIWKLVQQVRVLKSINRQCQAALHFSLNEENGISRNDPRPKYRVDHQMKVPRKTGLP